MMRSNIPLTILLLAIFSQAKGENTTNGTETTTLSPSDDPLVTTLLTSDTTATTSPTSSESIVAIEGWGHVFINGTPVWLSETHGTTPSHNDARAIVKQSLLSAVAEAGLKEALVDISVLTFSTGFLGDIAKFQLTLPRRMLNEQYPEIFTFDDQTLLQQHLQESCASHTDGIRKPILTHLLNIGNEFAFMLVGKIKVQWSDGLLDPKTNEFEVASERFRQDIMNVLEEAGLKNSINRISPYRYQRVDREHSNQPLDAYALLRFDLKALRSQDNRFISAFTDPLSRRFNEALRRTLPSVLQSAEFTVAQIVDQSVPHKLKFGGYLAGKKGHVNFEALYGPDNETVIEKAKKDFLDSLKLAIEKSPLKNTVLDTSQPKISAYALWVWVETTVTFDPIQLNRIDDKLDTNLGTAIIQDIVNEEIQKLDCAVVQLFELSDEIVLKFDEKRRADDMPE